MVDESVLNFETSIGNVVTTKIIDINHAFYLQSSDSPDVGLIIISFDGKRYQGWKILVVITISIKLTLYQFQHHQICSLGVDVMTR